MLIYQRVKCIDTHQHSVRLWQASRLWTRAEDVSPSAEGFSNDSAAVESVKETIAQEVTGGVSWKMAKCCDFTAAMNSTMVRFEQFAMFFITWNLASIQNIQTSRLNMLDVSEARRQHVARPECPQMRSS